MSVPCSQPVNQSASTVVPGVIAQPHLQSMSAQSSMFGLPEHMQQPVISDSSLVFQPCQSNCNYNFDSVSGMAAPAASLNSDSDGGPRSVSNVRSDPSTLSGSSVPGQYAQSLQGLARYPTGVSTVPSAQPLSTQFSPGLAQVGIDCPGRTCTLDEFQHLLCLLIQAALFWQLIRLHLAMVPYHH